MYRSFQKNDVEWLKSINTSNLEQKALELFHWQAENIPVYRYFLKIRKQNPLAIQEIKEIPFLPIEAFKKHIIGPANHTFSTFFESSGTTGQVRSRHYLTKPAIYDWTSVNGFEQKWGELEAWNILALLPNYLERENASLVYMVKKWMEKSGRKENGFYLDQLEDLSGKLLALQQKGEKTLLIGVSFALLDLAEKYPQNYSAITIMETGGMKGKRKEMIRPELHQSLQQAFNVSKIYSEYGMTELLSQAYSDGSDLFISPDYQKLLIRDITDPFDLKEEGKGALNVIDLANIYSCAFIETQDVGEIMSHQKFKVQGRIDHSEARGCNLMVSTI